MKSPVALSADAYRDGLSQAERMMMALDPGYVAVDERSLSDLIAFAQRYSQYVGFTEVVEGEARVTGGWHGFIDPAIDPETLAAYLNNPDAAPDTDRQRYAQPHLALFLVFLKLLEQLQSQFNALTGRHLDYYYQQVLGITRQAGVPDCVHVLVDLEDGIEQSEITAGTALDAGTDSQGQPLVYAIQSTTVISRAEVTQLKSLFVEQQVVGIPEVHQKTENKHDAFLAMLEMALGNPGPGDTLSVKNSAVKNHTTEPLTQALIEEFIDYTGLIRQSLFLDGIQQGLSSNYSDLRKLVQYKTAREKSGHLWGLINDVLVQTARKRTNNPGFQLGLSNSMDFSANLQEALGEALTIGGLPNVDSIYELYDRRVESDARKWIVKKLFFNFDDFVSMMQSKIQIDTQWQEILRIMEAAMNRRAAFDTNWEKPANWPLAAQEDPEAFDKNLQAVVDFNPLNERFGNGFLDAVYAQGIETLENSFYMRAEFVAFILRARDASAVASETWQSIYSLLAEAHIKKVYSNRQQQLETVYNTHGYASMIELAAGDVENSDATAQQRLLEFLDTDDADFVRTFSSQHEGDDASFAAPARLFKVAEAAWRAREQFARPVAQLTTWRNLWPAEDATAQTVSLGLESDQQTPRWRTFGAGVRGTDAALQPDPVFGWAISSPLLALSQGQRSVTLTLTFTIDQSGTVPAIDALNSKPFLVHVSTGKGWLVVEDVEIAVSRHIEQITADIVLGFAPDFPEISPLDATEPGSVKSVWPLVRFLLKPIEVDGQVRSAYPSLRELDLSKARIATSVEGLVPTCLENDDAVLKPGKPFEPFGVQPAAGSILRLAHREIIRQPLDTLAFDVEWMGAPTMFNTHYSNYSASAAISGNAAFSASIALIQNGRAYRLADSAPLFNESDAAGAHTIRAIYKPGFKRQLESTGAEDADDWAGYLQWQLNAPDFQHGVYATEALSNAVKLSTAIANKKDNDTIEAAAFQLNPPYTPKLKSVKIDYTASVDVTVADYSADQLDQIFHIEPFGYREIQPDPVTRTAKFLPGFSQEGCLYIGLANVTTPQTLSLLFQMADGSADPDVPVTPLSWSYLSGNRWYSLDNGKLLQDTTRGLINSGIILVALDSVQPNTLLSPELYWLRCSIPTGSRSVADVVSIHTQAVIATFLDQANAADHLSQPLPADTISDLLERNPAIKSVRQPYTSFGGKMAESQSGFYTRISERLRHKERAVTLWDFEHLTLEHFPELYKVKCLPPLQQQPGQVTLIVIPDIRDKQPFDPFEPKAPASLIASVQGLLQARLPLGADLTVKNATYVPVKVRVGVRFRDGYNAGFYLGQLNEDLRLFLSPWAYDDSADIDIGGHIYASVLVNFIEERPYIDYVAHISLFTNEDGSGFRPVPDATVEGYSAQTQHRDGILVSAQSHEIDVISEAGYEEENFTGINYMKLGLDFIVAAQA